MKRSEGGLLKHIEYHLKLVLNINNIAEECDDGGKGGARACKGALLKVVTGRMKWR